LPICAVVSVWPKPSRMVMPQAFLTMSITSGLSGSPAPTSSRSDVLYLPRSCCISMRHTVGGAHSEVTPFFTSTSSALGALKRA
jgi:hypothetical protein